MPRMRISVNHLRKGMVVANDVYNKSGVVLVAEGSPVTKEVVNILTRHFIDYVIVDLHSPSQEKKEEIPALENKEGTPRVPPEQFKKFEDSFHVAENALADNLKDVVYNSKDVNVPKLLEMTNSIIDKSTGINNLCDMLLMMKKNTEDLYTHCLNVSIFGQILGKWINCTASELEEITVAGLLHDLGLLKFSEQKMNEFTFRDELTGNGFDRHALNGYNMIKDQNISIDVKKAVLTHHERLDGTGFPLKVKQENINKISRIISIADTYDTFTMREPLVEPMPPFQALKEMEQYSFSKMDSAYMLTFVSHIAETMIQHKVLLSNGRIGQIVMINKYNICNPLVQVGSNFVDLSKEKQIYIRAVLD